MNDRSSRRGRERMRPKISEVGKYSNDRWSDLTVGENPCKGARDNLVPSQSMMSRFKCVTRKKASRISGASAAVQVEKSMERIRV